MQFFEETTEFERDEYNDVKNWTKHGLTQKEIEQAFFGFKIIFPDGKHSAIEERYCLIGNTDGSKVLFIAYTSRRLKIRVISARPASRLERLIYEKTSKKYSKI